MPLRLFLLPLVVLLLAACQPPAAPKSLATKIGQTCTIQFRRDTLGGSTPLPVGPTAESYGGSPVSIRGTLTKVTTEWVIIQTEPPTSRETWISRDAILLIQFAQ